MCITLKNALATIKRDVKNYYSIELKETYNYKLGYSIEEFIVDEIEFISNEYNLSGIERIEIYNKIQIWLEKNYR